MPDGSIQRIHAEDSGGEVTKEQLLQDKHLFRVNCSPETKIVTALLNKFSFVNEDILRTQVLKELQNFTNKDKQVDISRFYMTGTIGPFNFNQGSLTSPNKGIFDEENHMATLRQIQDPGHFWSNNGIGYDVSNNSLKPGSSTTVSKEKIRKRLDVLLYNVSRRIKHIMGQPNIHASSFEFADALVREIVTLNGYLQDQQSRILLYQFVEVCLEPILMIKKALIEVSLSSDILIMDFTK